MAQDQNRIDYLDAIRGLAAFSVLVYHSIFSRWGDRLEGKIGAVFFNGGGAVTMFFVLSGFVLSYKYISQQKTITVPEYKKFAISRVFRLYPAFLCMIFVYYIKEHWNEQSLAFWINTVVKNPHNFWEEAALIRGYKNLFFPAWTLGVEMAISLFVPFLILLVRYDHKLLPYFIGAVYIANNDYISTHFISFGFGILIAYHFNDIISFQDNSKWWYRWRWWFFPIVFATYSLYQIFRISPVGSTFLYFSDSFIKWNESLLSAVASAIMLLYIINSPRAKRILSIRPLLFLGKISYGLYLTHWLFIGLINSYIDKNAVWLPPDPLKHFAVLVIAATLLSGLSATFLYYAVEKPFIQLGRKLTKRYEV